MSRIPAHRPARVRAIVALATLGALVRTQPASAADDAAPSESSEKADTSDADKKEKPEKKGEGERPGDNSTKRVSFEMATYKDSDHITVFTPSIGATIENVTTGASLSGSYLVDVVSAASVDIVSTASRRWQETRQAGGLAGEYKPKDFGVGVAASASSEPDYFSYGISAQMTYDFDEKNTSLTAGYGFGHDTIGRGGTPFSVFSRTVTRGSFNGGITQVINRTTVAGLALDLVIENGDQSKPYRYVPMFAADVAPNVPKGASIDYVTAHRLFERPLDQTPLARRRFAATGRIAHRFESSTLRASERVYVDNWGLDASTTDLTWIFDLAPRFSLWPHARFHLQTPVSFWQRAYVATPGPSFSLPEFRTGDRELGPLWTATGGAGAKLYVGGAGEPRAWAIGVNGDVMYTSFLDDLYLTARTGFLGAMTLEGSF